MQDSAPSVAARGNNTVICLSADGGEGIPDHFLRTCRHDVLVAWSTIATLVLLFHCFARHFSRCALGSAPIKPCSHEFSLSQGLIRKWCVVGPLAHSPTHLYPPTQSHPLRYGHSHARGFFLHPTSLVFQFCDKERAIKSLRRFVGSSGIGHVLRRCACQRG